MVLGNYFVDSDILKVTGKRWCMVAEIDVDEAMAPVKRMAAILAVLIFLSALIVTIVSSIVSKRITDPIKMLSAAAGRISSGDLSVSVQAKGEDEIGQLAVSFNLMTESLATLVTKLNSSVSQITSASSEILAATQQQAAGAREQSAAVSETTAASKELSKSAEQVGESVKRVLEVANHALSGMAKIKGTIGKTGQIITSLNEKSQKIGKITEVIDDVADQTNLLAVNAAIEAARAGEQGRGFTVVADEIRKLADSTAKSTKDITALIEVIQHEMSNAIMSMETSIVSVDEESKLSQESAERSEEIAMSATQQISGSKQIAEAMSNVDEAMKQIAVSAQQSQVAVKQLADLGKELKSAAERFKLKKT
jgi:methyl-accepting chemotaxis protein